MINRKHFLHGVAASLAACALPSWSAEYPDKPVTLIVPYPPGGMGSTFGNLVSEAVAPGLGQPIVVDYKPGANGALGAGYVAKAAPDGYTLLMAVNSTMTINPSLYAKVPFDPVKDFDAVSMVFTNANLLVVKADSPVKSVQDLVSLAKAKPGTVNYGSAGNGSTTHLSGEMLRELTGAPVVHIPFKGSGPALIALMGDQLDFMFVDTSALPQVRAGKLRALAVSGRRRLGAAPELPTMEEAGIKGFYVDTWYSLVAPAGTPKAAIGKLNAQVARMLTDDKVRRRMLDMGLDPAEDTSAAYLQRVIREDTARWKTFLAKANIRLD